MTMTLRELRNKKKYTRDYVRTKLGTNISYISQIETGIRNPSDKMKLKLAEVYKVSPATIFLCCQATKCNMTKGKETNDKEQETI